MRFERLRLRLQGRLGYGQIVFVQINGYVGKKYKRNKYSLQLPLNGHLVNADTSLKRTRGVGPCCTSVILLLQLPPRRTPL